MEAGVDVQIVVMQESDLATKVVDCEQNWTLLAPKTNVLKSTVLDGDMASLMDDDEVMEQVRIQS